MWAGRERGAGATLTDGSGYWFALPDRRRGRKGGVASNGVGWGSVVDPCESPVPVLVLVPVLRPPLRSD